MSLSYAMRETLAQDVSDVLARDIPWPVISGARVLVTGATGFLGGHIARVMTSLFDHGKVSQPVRVVAAVRDMDRARARLGDLAESGKIELIEWDMKTIAIPEFGALDYVVHAASNASPRFYGSEPVATLLPNTVGVACLLEAMRRSGGGRGFLFVSSSEVYGQVPEGVRLDEDSYGVSDPTHVRSCYSESKRMGETMCAAWHYQYGLPCYIARPFHTYGPGLLPEDGRVFSDFAFNVVRGENIVMTSDGRAERAFCYVSDAVAGLFTVLLSGEPATAYNVANEDAILSVRQLAELLVGLFPEKELQVILKSSVDGAYLPSQINQLIPDVSRLKSLGWSAKISPSEGFRRMIEANQ